MAVSNLTPALRSPNFWRWVCVAVGILIRLTHLLRDPAIWHDEAALVLNVVYLDLAGCFGKLLHHEAAPPLFLVLERLAAMVLDDSELALRAPVFLVGCGSIVLFASLTKRVLCPWSAVLATALFAVSDRLIWHATEAKPYAVDAFIAILIAWGFVSTRDWPLRFQCALWLAILPVVEWLTFPGCFISGGLLLSLLPTARRAGGRDRVMFWLLGLAVVASFVVLALGPARAQQDGAMTGCWVNHFADWSRPGIVPLWAFLSTLEVLRYALMPLGQVLAAVVVVGAIRLGRRDWQLLTLFLTPLGLALVAALAGKYPYGGSRVCVFAAPALLLLVGEGVSPCWKWLVSRSRLAPLILIGALSLPFVQTVYRSAVPWPRADFREAVDFVESRMGTGDLIASDHWEVLYYMRGREVLLCDPAEVGNRRPSRVWIVTGTDPGVGEQRFEQLPSDWQQVDEVRFRGTRAVQFERRPVSTSAARAVP